MATQKTDVTVYIGRFNPFHLGHAHVLEQAIRSSQLTIVLVGSSGQARSLKNPFLFSERKNMIEAWYHNKFPQGAGTDMFIMPLLDHPYSDTKWIEQVQDKVKSAIQQTCRQSPTLLLLTDVRITGSDRDESTWYLHSFPQWKQALVPEFREDIALKVSATSVRDIMYGDKDPSYPGIAGQLANKVPFTTVGFITNFMSTDACKLLRREQEFVKAYKSAWSTAPYEPIFVTTDAVVVQSGHVLLVKRGAFPGEGLWALPGGFIDPHERLQNCVVREVMEETGIRLAEGKKAEDITRAILTASVKAKEIFDLPTRSSRGRTITTAYLIQLDDTKPLPKVKGMNAPLHETGGVEVVETIEAGWVPISDALRKTSMWFEDHHAILETMVAKLPQAR